MVQLWLEQSVAIFVISLSRFFCWVFSLILPEYHVKNRDSTIPNRFGLCCLSKVHLCCLSLVGWGGACLRLTTFVQNCISRWSVSLVLPNGWFCFSRCAACAVLCAEILRKESCGGHFSWICKKFTWVDFLLSTEWNLRDKGPFSDRDELKVYHD